jgi:hypothetical protein
MQPSFGDHLLSERRSDQTRRKRKEKKKKKGYLDFIFKAQLVSPMVTSNQQKMPKILFYQLY